jgi:hypothetical protein
MRCLCGAGSCRGVIGGGADGANELEEDEVDVHEWDDETNPEPIFVREVCLEHGGHAPLPSKLRQEVCTLRVAVLLYEIQKIRVFCKTHHQLNCNSQM